MANETPTTMFELCEVISVDDPAGGDRILARFSSDNTTKNSELPWAIPFLPKMLHVKPKVGELVGMFNIVNGDKESARFYIGPFVTQHVDMHDSPKDSTEIGEARGFLQGAYQTVADNPENRVDAIGAFPENSDISIEGRKNCGLQITDDDIRLKAGVKKLNINDHTAVFNRDNSAFIKLKYDDEHPENGYSSVAYIVADRINLLGSSPGGNGALKDYKTDNSTKYERQIPKADGTTEIKTYNAFQRDLITNKEEKNIMRSPEDEDFDGDRYAYRMVYGEPLIEFLEMFRDAFFNHVHPFPTMTPCNTDEIKNLMKYQLKDNLLSNTVRIN